MTLPISSNFPSDPPLDPQPDHPPIDLWGFWAMLVWSVLLTLLFIGMQTLGAGWVISQQTQLDPGLAPVTLIERIENNGTAVTIATLLSSTACIAGILGIAALRKSGSPWAFLQIRAPELRQLGLWLLITLGVIVGMDSLKGILGLEIVPQFSIDIYTTADSLPLLYLAVVILAPLYEEMMFRGFLLQRLHYSWLGSGGALWITALIWAAIHTQYDLINVLTIVLFGLLLGLAQLRTQCLVIPMTMHILNNLISMLQAAWQISSLS